MTQFQGRDVLDNEAILQRIVVGTDRSFKLGEVLKLAIEVRVTAVAFEEDRDGRVVATHKFNVEDVEVLHEVDPATDMSTIGGDLSSSREQTTEEAEELGISFGRTAALAG